MDYTEMVDMLGSRHFNHKDNPFPQSWRGLDLKKMASYFRVSEAEVLRAMHEIASRANLRYGETRCNSCGMPITFQERTPFDRSKENHFIACPNRQAHRRRK